MDHMAFCMMMMMIVGTVMIGVKGCKLENFDVDSDRYTVVWNSTETLKWRRAREYCQELGADLAILETQEELDYVAQISVDTYGGSFWIGLNDRDNEGEFVWAGSRQPLTDMQTTYWKDREPNNSGNEDCVQILMSDGKASLNDKDCGAHLKFICEKYRCKSQHFFPQYHRRLLKHVIRSMEVDSLNHCGRLCATDSECFSANFYLTEGVGSTCDLNSRTNKHNMADFVYEEGAVYISGYEPWL